MNSTEWTFWRFLKESEIEIPIIQRDYAQGRAGKEELLKSFLRDLTDALGTNKRMKLDFVYGTNENGVLIPIDGQQRLTTLWLLHWYVAYRAQKLDKPTIERLRKFSYRTRLSSRQFCEKLAGFSELPPDDLDVASHIRNQVWFRRAWRNDPTIQSMLRMISGTLEDKSDGIDGVVNSQQSADYWNKLTSSDCPIVFYHLNLYGISHSDDLYIKMNARGKPLTSFENFKADLTGYVKEMGNSALNDPRTGLSIKMDTAWMNVFWQNRSSDNAVDEIYFAFLVRYFFNACVLQLTKTDDLQKGDNPVFDFLYGRNASSAGENEKIAYLGFDEVFKKVLDGDNTLLSRLYKTLENFSSCRANLGNETEKFFEAPWNDGKDGKFRFVPHYENREPLSDFAGNRIRAIDRITQPHRVVFHAVCKFFAQGWDAEAIEKEKAALRDWMRVVWNIVENANVDTISGMVGCLRLIDQLSEHSHNILDAFAKDFAPSSSFAKDQVSEEIEKARKILAGGAEWEKKIVCAENYAFFHGAIRFLFHDEVGNEKWDDFDAKWFNAQSYFDTNGVRKTFRKNALLLRAFLARIGESNLTEKFWFGNGADFWRNQVLLNAEFNSVVSELLLTDITPDNDIPNNTPDWIADNALLSDAIEKDNDSNGQWHIVTDWFRIGDKDKTLTRYANRIKGNVNYPGQIIPLGNLLRNELLVGLESEQRIGKRYFIGWTSDINFLYNGRWFQWYGTPSEGECDIYLLKNDWKNQIDPYEQHQEDPDKRGDERTYYCFKVDAAETKDSFRDKLNALIKCAGKQ